jgi:hypothetical protein
MNKQKINIKAAAIALSASGRIIGPYFLGKSFEAIQDKFSDKLKNPLHELVEVGLERVREKRGFLAAKEKITSEEVSACMISE